MADLPTYGYRRVWRCCDGVGRDGLPVVNAKRVYRIMRTHNLLRHCCKVSDEAAFVLFKGLTFQKLCLPGAFRPGSP
ncbi:IS3 family transposase [Klebsiella pneumoniae]|uniref:IS3 family transposase n=1 Tax=Klebsiella pneumoniae TaxID=573 RepID=A0A939SUD3_KLEPN|nr:IS3 family transposase [Klebsiella pneumoniae]